MLNRVSSPACATRFGLFATLALMAFGTPVAAGVPTDANTRAQLIGQPTALTVQPATLTLKGPRATAQLIVTGQYADGTVRDLTPFSDWNLEQPDLLVLENGFVTPRKNGQTTLVIKAGGQTARVPVTVQEFDTPQPYSFRHDLIAALNVGGCNAGACHGTPSGKGGFRLSLRGFEPAADYLQLTRDVFGRRTGRLDAMESLIVKKALGRVPHEGGQRFQPTSIAAKVFEGWLSEGLRDDPTTLPALTKIEIAPGNRVLNQPSRWQQLAVLGHFSDGGVRDVTRLTVFSSSDNAVADVNGNGLVEFSQSGEVAILCRYLDELQSVRLTYLEPRKGFTWANPPEHNYVDQHVFAKLKMLSIAPSDLCSDQEFIRRIYLDTCGILPTADEVKAFLANTDKDKRTKLIGTLLERPEYADYWTLKWSDVLRSSRKTIQVKGIHVFQTWLRGHVGRNSPFDQVVREILTANGSTYANPPANYYRIARDPQNLAETTAQLFFGVRMQCAKCHNHPFERWTQDDYYSLAAFFARVKQKKEPGTPAATPQNQAAEVIYSDRAGEVVQPRTGKTMPPKIMGVAAPTVAPGRDRREVLAEAITAGDNPFFAKATVNRIWFHLTGRGIVDPVDDFRDSNPSANDPLLDALAKDFIKSGYDVKHIVRVILTSRTYQLSAQSNEFNKDDSKYFSHAVTRLIPAEPLLDAICAATDVPEKFAGLPPGTRATQLPDGEINHVFLKTFGQPGRELACECEREGDSNLAQALQLINGPTINEKIRNPNNRIGKLLAKKASDTDLLNDVYLATLSRPPSPPEVQAALDHVGKAQDKRKAWEDVLWALLNCKEFLFRH